MKLRQICSATLLGLATLTATLATRRMGPNVSTIQYTANENTIGRLVLLSQILFSTLSTDAIRSNAVTINPQVPTAVILLELATNCSR